MFKVPTQPCRCSLIAFILALSVLAVYALGIPTSARSSECAFDELRVLTAYDAASIASNDFSWSVAIEGSVMVIGARRDAVTATDAGTAYVYEFDGTNWVGVARLGYSDENSIGLFGHAVAIRGDVIVVGAPSVGGTLPSNGPGATYVFEKPAGGWVDTTETAKLTVSAGGASDRMGWSVAIDGDLIAVGAFGANANRGSVYIYEKPAGGWVDTTESATLTPSDGAAADFFGSSVSLDNDVLVAGSPRSVSGGFGSGSAYIYEKPAGGWTDTTETAKLTPSTPSTNDEFGVSVAIDSNTIVIGDQFENTPGNRPGAAYVFAKPAGGWTDTTETAVLTISDAQGQDRLGISVAVAGKVVLLGAYRHGLPTSDAGAVYVYREPASGWVSAAESAKFTRTTSTQRIGYAVSMWKDIALVGSQTNETAFVFRGISDCNANDTLDVCEFGANPYLDCNGNGVLDSCEISANSSLDLDSDGVLDECEDSAIVNMGGSHTLTPGGGAASALENSVVEFENATGADSATIHILQVQGQPQPDSGYAVFDRTLMVVTSLADGEFFARISIPFDAADVGALHPFAVDLTFYSPDSMTWVLAAEHNTVNSPGKSGPVGDQYLVSSTMLPTLSDDIGDYGTYWNPVAEKGFAWANVDHTSEFSVGIPLFVTGIGDTPVASRKRVWVYPNPFNPSTTIRYEVPRSGDAVLRIYDVRGQLVHQLLNRRMDAGIYQIRWDGTNAQGKQVASGVYFLTAQVPGEFHRVKIVVIR